MWMFSTLALLTVAVASAGIARSSFEAPKSVQLARRGGDLFQPYAKGQHIEASGSDQDNLTALVTNDSEHPIPVVQKSRDQMWDYLYFDNFKQAFEFFNVQPEGARTAKENLLKMLGQRGWRLVPSNGVTLIFEKPINL